MSKRKLSKEDKINFFLKFLMVFLFVLGASIFFYPIVADSLNNYIDQQRISYYIDQTEKENQEKVKKRESKLAQKNQEIAQSINVPGMTDVKDPFALINDKANQPTKAYYQKHSIGAIFIPAIEVSLPLFDTTNDTLLAEGATVLQGSSYPIGGESTHSVITGHTGLPDKTIFTNLTELKRGEMIYLHVLGKKLAYKIQSFKVVKPDDLDDLKIIPGKDLITLVTCTPYMINTDRLLVTAYRSAYPSDVDKKISQIQTYHRLKFMFTLIGVSTFFALFFVWLTRKILALLATKRSYQVGFYLEKNGVALKNQQVTLVYGWPKRTLKKDQTIIEAVSDETGKVAFSSLPGRSYRVLIKEDSNRWPKIRMRVKKLKDWHLVVCVAKRYRTIETSEGGRVSLKIVHIQAKK